MTRVIRIRQCGWIAGWGGWKKRKAGEISAQPSVRGSHRLRLPTPLGRFQHTRHCAVHIWIITAAQLQPYHPAALPSVHQTSIDWVHLVPCDAFSQSLIYKEINGLHNNKGLNASIKKSAPSSHNNSFQCNSLTQSKEVDNVYTAVVPPSWSTWLA